jgi:hypothetical protein
MYNCQSPSIMERFRHTDSFRTINSHRTSSLQRVSVVNKPGGYGLWTRKALILSPFSPIALNWGILTESTPNTLFSSRGTSPSPLTTITLPTNEHPSSSPTDNGPLTLRIALPSTPSSRASTRPPQPLLAQASSSKPSSNYNAKKTPARTSTLGRLKC